MDIRIVNTCNSDCLYCLEQDLREKQKYIPYEEICRELKKETQREILSFYGGNPLLHPELREIILYGKKLGYKNISLLTNTFSLDADLAQSLKDAGLSAIQFYFHSFDKQVHDRIVGGGISLEILLQNIQIIRKFGLQSKVIIHVNGQNISTLLRDIKALHKYFSFSYFELINYYPVSRAYEKYDAILKYTEDLNTMSEIQKYIDIIGGELRCVNFDTYSTYG